MQRPIRTETTGRRFELALAAWPVAPARVQPRHRDVDEALQEVTLLERRLPPFVLELLVRLEVLARPDELQTALEAHHADYPSNAASVGPVATILLVGVDLFFRSKLEGLLPEHRFVTSDSVGAPDLVITDIARVDPDEVVEEWPDIPIVGFANHTDKTGLQRANAAGFDQVIVKSALVERAPELVAELTGIS